MGLWDSISNGLAAAANHGAEIFQKRALLEAQNEAEIAREQRLEEYRAARELAAEERKETARKAEVRAVNTRADELGGVPEARGLVDAGITDRSAWTPEHQAAVDQSMQLRRDENRTAAATDLGVISPKEVFSAEREDKRYEATERRQAERDDRLDRRAADAQDRIDARQDRALARDNGKTSDPRNIRERLSLLDGQRKAIDSETATERDLYRQALDAATGSEAKKRVQEEFGPKFKSLTERRREAEQEYKTLKRMLDDTPAPTIRANDKPAAEPAAAPKPAPAPKAAPAAPAASAPMSSSSRPQSPRPEGDDTDTARIIRSEYQAALQKLASTSDPDAKRRLQGDLAALENEAKRGKFSLMAGGAAPAARPPLSAFNR